MIRYIFLSLFLILVGCVKGTVGDGVPTETPNPGSNTGGNGNNSPTGSVQLTLSSNLSYFGVVNLSSIKNQSITLTNTGTKKSSNINISVSGDSNFSFTSSCSGQALNPGQSCLINISLSAGTIKKGLKKNFIIYDGSMTVQLVSIAYVFDFNLFDKMIEKIIEKQSLTTDYVNGVYEGAWQTDSNISQLINNLFISNSIIESKDYYFGNFNNEGRTTLFTPNINFNSYSNTNWKVLDRSLFYTFLNDKNTVSYSDDSFIKLDPDDVGTEYNTSFQKWNDSEYNKPKYLGANLIFLINKNYNLLYGTNISNYSNIMNKYLNSHKKVTTDISNNITLTEENIEAQINSLLDPNNMIEGVKLENRLKMVDFYFKYLKSINDTNRLDKISKLYINRWSYDYQELQDEPTIFSPSLNLKYNKYPFDYTSFNKPGTNKTTLYNDKLWWMIDFSFSQSGCYDNLDHFMVAYTTKAICESNSFIWKIGFEGTYSCRDISYSVINLINSYYNGTFSNEEKNSISLLLQNGLLEIRNYSGCGYDSSSKKFVSHINYDNSYNENNGIPIIFKAYNSLPINFVNSDARINLYNQLVSELDNSGSININDSSYNPLYLSEALLYLKDQIIP